MNTPPLVTLLICAGLFFIVWKYKAEQSYEKNNIDSAKVLSSDGRMYALDGTEIVGIDVIQRSVPFEMDSSTLEKLASKEQLLLVDSIDDFEDSPDDEEELRQAESEFEAAMRKLDESISNYAEDFESGFEQKSIGHLNESKQIEQIISPPSVDLGDDEVPLAEVLKRKQVRNIL